MTSAPVRFSILLFLVTLASASGDEPVDFSRDIRPILGNRCFKCHGFDDHTREADLGLHTFEHATRDLGGYFAIKPGDPEASNIIERMMSDDPDEVMPPPQGQQAKTVTGRTRSFSPLDRPGGQVSGALGVRKTNPPETPWR